MSPGEATPAASHQAGQAKGHEMDLEVLEVVVQRCTAARDASAKAGSALASALYQRDPQQGTDQPEDVRLRFMLASLDREVVKLMQALTDLWEAVAKVLDASPPAPSGATTADASTRET